MVRVISTSGIRMGVHEDLYDHAVDGVDYTGCQPDYDYMQDLPDSAKQHGKRKVVYQESPQPTKVVPLFLGESIMED
jgi:hypothetical protein